jgi:hypothetical protein
MFSCSAVGSNANTADSPKLDAAASAPESDESAPAPSSFAAALFPPGLLGPEAPDEDDETCEFVAVFASESPRLEDDVLALTVRPLDAPLCSELTSLDVVADVEEPPALPLSDEALLEGFGPGELPPVVFSDVEEGDDESPPVSA